MMVSYLDLATMLNVDVIGLEYTGYGKSSGQPHYREVESDIQAAYDFIIKELKVDPASVLLYGQSVGSAPVLALASRITVAGVVLHSPFLSAISVLDPEMKKCCRPSQCFACCDIFPNRILVQKLSSELLIIHGKDDDVIPVTHGRRLAERYRMKGKRVARTYFPSKCGHNDIVEVQRAGFYTSLISFLHTLFRQDGQIRWTPTDFLTQIIMPDDEEESVMSEIIGNDDSPVIEISDPPGQEEMTPPRAKSFEGSRATAGPTDGRYAKIRQGKVVVPQC